SARAALKRHPWAIGLMDSRRSPGPTTLHPHDAVLGCLREAGFSVPMAARAFSLLDSYIYGFVLQEVSLPLDTPDEVEELAGELLDALPADEFPYLAELTRDHVLRPGYDYADEFSWGLERILVALRP
ncbi:MAG: TetR/AcrR family transcriptional regulator C-terminal domain-containing protein, partial [Miltoncostaeaceae bacterium]